MRLITATSIELKSFFQNLLVRQNWRPCRNDIECYLALDPTALRVGLLNGKPIAVQAMFKYAHGYRHGGAYVVDEQYRGQGFGPNLLRECIKKSAPITNLSGYSCPELTNWLEKSLNISSRWYGSSYNLDILKSLERLKTNLDISYATVKRINKINIQDLYNYDRFVFGYNRKNFLEMWLNTPGSHSRVAIDKEGFIIGYITVRIALIQDEGYKIGPLFAKNIEVAKLLLNEVFEEVRECGASCSTSVIADSPVGRNPEARKLMQSVDAKYLANFELVTTNGFPRGNFDDWFVITGLLCG